MASEEGRLLLIGTYTHKNNSKGIYLARQDKATGNLTIVGAAPFVDSPSFLAIHPSKRFVYACNEVPGEPYGAVSAFSLDPATGAMALLNQESTQSAGPCHVNIDATGKLLAAANYSGGAITAFPILADGKVGPASDLHQFVGSSIHPKRQQKAYAHSVWPDPTNTYMLACDLGSDKVMIYRMDLKKAKLVPARQSYARVQAGSGPRHIEFHPNKQWCYLVNEVASSVTLFDWDAAKGTLTEIQHVPALPEGIEGNTAADIHITPDGRYLYATNRGHNTFAMFAIEPGTGLLSFLGYESVQGDHPRNFSIDPAGEFVYVANMLSSDIYSYRIAADGRLTPTGWRLQLPAPVCIKFV